MVKFLGDREDKADGEVVFFDGYLYIISRTDDVKYSIEVKMVFPENGDHISLAEILMRYPDVTMVIHDDWLGGEIFRYGNHEKGVWEQVGTTVGFA